jgi:hypothetical protein
MNKLSIQACSASHRLNVVKRFPAYATVTIIVTLSLLLTIDFVLHTITLYYVEILATRRRIELLATDRQSAVLPLYERAIETWSG